MVEVALSPAEEAAAAAQAQVTNCLLNEQNFRLEAGAGAGKTYSLVAALKWLIADRGSTLLKRGQKVACITYTQVARDEILQKIDVHPAIHVDTIHAFSWGIMQQFQSGLRDIVSTMERYQEKLAEVEGIGSRRVEYKLGFFGIDDHTVTLSHDDVPYLMARLLGIEKFRQTFQRLYPIVLIDEYQDTDSHFMQALSDHFFSTNQGPLIGLFGDQWQKIYGNSHAAAHYPNVQSIDKGANFRSAPAIVDVLNSLRPDLVQAVCDPNAPGEARVFHTNDWEGERFTSRNGRDDLSAAAAHRYLETLREHLADEGWDFAPDETKILMLTHNVLAQEQGYPTIADIFDRTESFVKKEDKHIEFLLDKVEPMCRAYAEQRYGRMFEVLGSMQAIRSHADKVRWRDDMAMLSQLRLNGSIGNVIDHLRQTRRPRLPESVERRESELVQRGPVAGDDEPRYITRLRRLRDVPYSEITALANYVEGSTPFATKHGVKGAEFENVLVVLGGGWNHYNWPQLLELLTTREINSRNEKAFLRARNLLYVALSRPKKRLAVLVTQSLPATAIGTLNLMFGEDCVVPAPL
ncbi:MAG TPA: UvrD-helicase domain-containing protein [Rhodocyclaceae bacterium]|nr:UvrD-helicase domain-containing protein [Rhodocyclaceae bacterium]